jgi:hypothetical protein
LVDHSPLPRSSSVEIGSDSNEKKENNKISYQKARWLKECVDFNYSFWKVPQRHPARTLHLSCCLQVCPNDLDLKYLIFKMGVTVLPWPTSEK